MFNINIDGVAFSRLNLLQTQSPIISYISGLKTYYAASDILVFRGSNFGVCKSGLTCNLNYKISFGQFSSANCIYFNDSCISCSTPNGVGKNLPINIIVYSISYATGFIGSYVLSTLINFDIFSILRIFFRYNQLKVAQNLLLIRYMLLGRTLVPHQVQ